MMIAPRCIASRLYRSEAILIHAYDHMQWHVRYSLISWTKLSGDSEVNPYQNLLLLIVSQRH